MKRLAMFVMFLALGGFVLGCGGKTEKPKSGEKGKAPAGAKAGEGDKKAGEGDKKAAEGDKKAAEGDKKAAEGDKKD